MTFRQVFVHIILSSVWVAEWPPFRKELLTRLTICLLCILTIVILVISRFGFECGIWVLIAPVSCLTLNTCYCFVYWYGRISKAEIIP